jgi:hypothetical protein
MVARLSSSTAGPAAAGPAAFAGGLQAVVGLADDVAAAVFGQGECEVEDEGPPLGFVSPGARQGVPAGRGALRTVSQNTEVLRGVLRTATWANTPPNARCADLA